MEDKDIFLGSHVKMGAPDYFLGSVKEAIEYNANTFMFYTGAPQNSFRKPLKDCKIEEGLALMKEVGLDPDKLVCHAPYIVNLGNRDDEEKWNVSVSLIEREVVRCNAFHCKILVLHPGAHLKKGNTVAIKNIADALDIIFEHTKDLPVRIALETMAGKGTEVGVTFQELADIINTCHYPNRLGICLDTCHINDYGYNVKDINEVLNEFDSIIGLDRLLALHINDSKNIRGSHKDRHENIGYGEIGFDALSAFIHDERLKGLPKILETPYVKISEGIEKPPYKEEISMLRSNKFINNWRDNF